MATRPQRARLPDALSSYTKAFDEISILDPRAAAFAQEARNADIEGSQALADATLGNSEAQQQIARQEVLAKLLPSALEATNSGNYDLLKQLAASIGGTNIGDASPLTLLSNALGIEGRQSDNTKTRSEATRNFAEAGLVPFSPEGGLSTLPGTGFRSYTRPADILKAQSSSKDKTSTTKVQEQFNTLDGLVTLTRDVPNDQVPSIRQGIQSSREAGKKPTRSSSATTARQKTVLANYETLLKKQGGKLVGTNDAGNGNTAIFYEDANGRSGYFIVDDKGNPVRSE